MTKSIEQKNCPQSKDISKNNLFEKARDAVTDTAQNTRDIIKRHPFRSALVVGTGVAGAYDLTHDHIALNTLSEALTFIRNRLVAASVLPLSQQSEIQENLNEFTTDPIQVALPTGTAEATATSSPTTAPTTAPATVTETALSTPTQSALMEVTPTEKQEQEYKYQINSPVPEAEKGRLRILINTQRPEFLPSIIYSPSDPTTPVSIYAIWDGDLQPGRADLPGARVPSLTLKNAAGIEVYYLFNGDVEGNPTLPRKVRAGEKVGTLKGPLPPIPFDPSVKLGLSLSFQKPSPGSLPIPLDARDFGIK